MEATDRLGVRESGGAEGTSAAAGTRTVSVIIPAFAESGRVGETVRAAAEALCRFPGCTGEVLVVDDGSPDDTAAEAERAGARVLRLSRNLGKGGALARGIAAARGDILLLLDADLRDSASEAWRLLEPVLRGEADMSIARFPRHAGPAGFGLVMRLAHWGLRTAGGTPLEAPLSGQRALTREAWGRIGRLDPGFGLEMGLNLDAFRHGLRVVEVETQMRHRRTGKDLRGFLHRGRQFRDVALAIARRWPLAPRAGSPSPGKAPP